jgi:hypothetical protein
MNVYKLTDQNMQTHGGYQWVLGEWRETSGEGDLCGPGWLHWYSDPLLAGLLNPIHANFSNPRLFLAETDGEIRDDRGLKGGSTRLRLVEEKPLSEATTEQRVRFAILCAQSVIMDGCPEWSAWAAAWLDGTDRAEAAAEAARTGEPLDLTAIAAKAVGGEK